MFALGATRQGLALDSGGPAPLWSVLGWWAKCNRPGAVFARFSLYMKRKTLHGAIAGDFQAGAGSFHGRDHCLSEQLSLISVSSSLHCLYPPRLYCWGQGESMPGSSEGKRAMGEACETT